MSVKRGSTVVPFSTSPVILPKQSPGGMVSQRSIRTSLVENGSRSDRDCSANVREGLFTTLGKHVLVSTERKMQEEARYLKR